MELNVKEKLYVIDGHALCYRAYYAFIRNPLFNSSGQNTSAIFGFARMLYKLIEEQNPDYLVVAFDPPKKSFRFDIYPEYKDWRFREAYELVKVGKGMLDLKKTITESRYTEIKGLSEIYSKVLSGHKSPLLEEFGML